MSSFLCSGLRRYLALTTEHGRANCFTSSQTRQRLYTCAQQWSGAPSENSLVHFAVSGPDWKLEDDLKTLTVSFPSNPPVALKLDAAGVQDLLANLGEFRSFMTPEIEKDWTPGQRAGAIPDPRWMVEPELIRGNSFLHLRDPHLAGCTTIPREEARKLGQLLIALADAPPPELGQARPS